MYHSCQRCTDRSEKRKRLKFEEEKKKKKRTLRQRLRPDKIHLGPRRSDRYGSDTPPALVLGRYSTRGLYVTWAVKTKINVTTSRTVIYNAPVVCTQQYL